MATMARTLCLLTLLAGATAAKDSNTIVFAAFGDWGWSPVGANNSMLLDTTAQRCFALAGNASALQAASCIGNSGFYILAGYSQLSQNATANAMGAACAAAGGCDFLVNTGDSFYDLGIVNGVTDPQWQYAFQNVFNAAGIPNGTPILSTLGNHDYNAWVPNAAASQVAYTSVDPSRRWYLPQRGTYARTFSSASGAVSVNVVQLDSTVLNDRYMYGGASGGGFATGVAGRDTVGGATGRVNSPATATVLNPSVTAANGFSGNLYNASNFVCTYNFATNAGVAAPPLGYASGCKYASVEFGAYASPAGRAAAYANATAALAAGLFTAQHALLFSHFPILSSEQRMTPYYDGATAMLASLGSAAPQVYFNGHDHNNAFLSSPALTTVGAGGAPTPIGFYTSGSAGVPEYGYAPLGGAVSDAGYTGANAMPLGYATGAAAVAAVSSRFTYAPQPASGASGPTSYNPDVNLTAFWSGWSGFVLNTVNATSWRVDIYLVNCTQQYLGQPCSNTIGPLFTKYYAARPTLPAGTPAAAAVTVTAVLAVPGLSATAAALNAALATAAGASASITSVVGTTVTLAVATTAGAAGAAAVSISTLVANGALATVLAQFCAGGATPAITFVTMPVATLAPVPSSAARRGLGVACVALAAAAVAALA